MTYIDKNTAFILVRSMGSNIKKISDYERILLIKNRATPTIKDWLKKVIMSKKNGDLLDNPYYAGFDNQKKLDILNEIKRVARDTKAGIISSSAAVSLGDIKFNTIFGNSNLTAIRDILFPKSGQTRQVVTLDTSKVSSSLTAGSKFGWIVSDTVSLESGTITILGFKNLIAMRIISMSGEVVSTPSHTFTAGGGRQTVSNTGQSPIYYNDFPNKNFNFTVLIHEFSTQATLGKNGRKFHFTVIPNLVNPETLGDGATWSPSDPYYEFTSNTKNNGAFKFSQPIKQLSTLTISIGNPIDLFTVDNTTRFVIQLELTFQNADIPAGVVV